MKCFNCKELGHSTVKCPKNTQTLTQPLKKKKEIKRDWVPKKTDNANDWRVVQRPSGMKQRADMIENVSKMKGSAKSAANRFEMLSNEDLSVDDVILPKESNAVLCQENIDKVEPMHHHSYENEGKQQTIQESPSFAAIVKGSESGAREEDDYLKPIVR